MFLAILDPFFMVGIALRGSFVPFVRLLTAKLAVSMTISLSSRRAALGLIWRLMLFAWPIMAMYLFFRFKVQLGLPLR
jgi:hypothetical protein